MESEAEEDEEEDEEEGEEDVCHLCGASDEGDILLLCDSCGEGAGRAGTEPPGCPRCSAGRRPRAPGCPARPLTRLALVPAALPADNACHLSCCNPPLKRVPKGDWFCVECTARQQAEAAAAKAK